LIKLVAGVHLPQIELEVVFVGDVDPKVFDANFSIIKTFSKGGDVYIPIPFGPILDLDELLGVHIKWTPSYVQMLEDLDGLHILIGGVEVAKL
jgi:hypothetical protein